jgi:hypothetical protein
LSTVFFAYKKTIFSLVEIFSTVNMAAQFCSGHWTEQWTLDENLFSFSFALKSKQKFKIQLKRGTRQVSKLN